jgi:hypothetical protein
MYACIAIVLELLTVAAQCGSLENSTVLLHVILLITKTKQNTHDIPSCHCSLLLGAMSSPFVAIDLGLPAL